MAEATPRSAETRTGSGEAVSGEYDPSNGGYRQRPTSTYLPQPGSRKRAYLDFVSGVKVFTQQKVTPAVRAEYDARAGKASSPPTGGDEAARLLADSPTKAFQEFLLRKSQEMMWAGAEQALAPQAKALEAAIDRPLDTPRGSLTLDPTLSYPAYFTAHDIHIQPGAYAVGALVGPVYEVGSAIYSSRPDYDNQTEKLFVLGLPSDPARPPRKVLDLGCGIGKSTRYLAERFLPTGAEIHAVDLSAPICKYAHKRMEELGLPVHVRQADAANLPYADDTFDLIGAKILFHELPRRAVPEVIREAFRVLSPGGFFAIGDLKPYRLVDPFMEMMYDWQVRHNGEPYWRESLTLDYGALFREAGFTDVFEGPNAADPSPRGFPWFTSGRKPG